MADCDVNKVITIMNDSDQGESMTVQEAPLMGKLTPRLLRTLSSESNLQTLSLGTSSDNDSLATISLAEIGGIPQSGSTTSLDPNLLIGLSPETLNMMTNSFPFLPTTSGTNDLSIGASGGDLPNCSVNDLESLTRHSSDRIAIRTRVSNSLPTQPVMSCLNTIQSGRTSTSKNEKPSLGPAIPLEVDGVCSDSNVVTIVNSAIVRNPQGVSGINCARANSDTVTISHGQEIQPKSNQTLNLFDNSLENRTDTLNSNIEDSSHVSEGTHQPVTVEAFLNESRPGPSQESMSLTLSRPTSLSNSGEAVSDRGVVQATEPQPAEDPQGQNSLLVASENNVQYVSITVPNVEINSSGQLVISHVSLLQAPQTNSFIPLVTQSVEAPVISQTEVPDSTSDGLTPTLTRRKGGWPKGKRRKVNPVEATQVPRAPTTSYMIYFRENRERIEKEHQSLSFKDLLKVIGNSWAALTDDERKIYRDKAARLKQQYLSEVKTHAQTEAYQTLIRKEAVKKLSNADGDFPGSDDILFMSDFSLVEEDPLNPNELYCKVCDQYFSNVHNKKEHLSGRQHVNTVGKKLYCFTQQQDHPDQGIPGADQLEGLEESVKKDLANLSGIRAEIMELHAQRELEVKNLKREATDNLLKNIQLNRELKDLQDTYEKLEVDLKSLKTIEASLQGKLSGLRLLMTLFGVLHFR